MAYDEYPSLEDFLIKNGTTYKEYLAEVARSKSRDYLPRFQPGDIIEEQFLLNHRTSRKINIGILFDQTLYWEGTKRGVEFWGNIQFIFAKISSRMIGKPVFSSGLKFTLEETEVLKRSQGYSTAFEPENL